MSSDEENDKKKLLIDSDSEDQAGRGGRADGSLRSRKRDSQASADKGADSNINSDSNSRKDNLNSRIDKETDSSTDSGSDTGTSSGGQGGGIDFVDFTSTSVHTRDDLLSPEEKKRLLSTHKDINEVKVKQQKEKRDHYKDLKNGKISLLAHRAGLAAQNIIAKFKANPILANKAQFSGIDKTVSTLPNEALAETNEDKRNELQNELRHQLGYQNTPKFNPKPRGPGW